MDQVPTTSKMANVGKDVFFVSIIAAVLAKRRLWLKCLPALFPCPTKTKPHLTSRRSKSIARLAAQLIARIGFVAREVDRGRRQRAGAAARPGQRLDRVASGDEARLARRTRGGDGRALDGDAWRRRRQGRRRCDGRFAGDGCRRAGGRFGGGDGDGRNAGCIDGADDGGNDGRGSHQGGG